MPQANPLVIAGGVVVFVGFLLLLIGVFTPGWISFSFITQGLFQGCYKNGPCDSIDLSYQLDFFKATAALEILAFIASLACLAVTAVYVVFAFLGKESGTVQLLPIVALITSVVAGIFAIVGVIVYGAEVKFNLDYSFALTIVGAIILVVGGALVFVSKNGSKIGGY